MNRVRHSSYCYVQAIVFEVDGGCSGLSAAGLASAAACGKIPFCRFTSYMLDEFESSLYDKTLTSSVCG